MTHAHAEADFSWIRPRRFEGYVRDAEGNRLYVVSAEPVKEGKRLGVVEEGGEWRVVGKAKAKP